MIKFCYVAQAGLDFVILPLCPPESCGYMHTPSAWQLVISEERSQIAFVCNKILVHSDTICISMLFVSLTEAPYLALTRITVA